MKYKVYRIGTHPRDLLEPEREELAKVDAEQIVLPRLEGDDLVSKARDDFPEPDKPVIPTNLSLGIVTSIFFRLCCLAPLIVMLFFEVFKNYV